MPNDLGIVVIGRNEVTGAWDGESFDSKDRFTDVFIRRDGQWVCVSTHTCAIAEK